MHLKSIGPRSNAEQAFERMSRNERPMARGAAGGVVGEARLAPVTRELIQKDLASPRMCGRYAIKCDRSIGP